MMYVQQVGKVIALFHQKSLFNHTLIAVLVILNFLFTCINVSTEINHGIAAASDNTYQFSQVPTKNNAIDRTTTHNMNKNYSSEIGVWFYANRYSDTIPKIIVDKLQGWKINTIYFAGTDIEDWNNQSARNIYSTFIRHANDKGIKVYAVTLEDPSFALKTSAELEDTFKQFIDLTRDLFDTYVIDVEPHAILGPDVHTFVPEYIRMSHILGRIAQEEKIRYIDTVPYWYHTVIRQMGISPGLDILASNGVNLMTYTYTSNQTLEYIKQIESEIKKPVTISIKITPGQQAPQLKMSELSKTIDEFNSQALNFTIYEAQYILSR